MKQLELNLQKRLLIVETNVIPDLDGMYIELICKGSELTEEIAKGLVGQRGTDFYEDYTDNSSYNKNLTGFGAIESFISVIEASGHYWLHNPKPHPSEIEPTNRKHYDKIVEDWQEAESRTFNPEKTIIFEII